MDTIFIILESATHNPLLQFVALAIVFDTIFGVIRAVREHQFNSCVGIDGAIRKVSMIISLIFLVLADALVNVNLIGFIPQELRETIGLEQIGLSEFFCLLYIAYEVISILKNMALCGLPVNGIWHAVRAFLSKYTEELPDNESEDKLVSDMTEDELDKYIL